MRLTLQTYRQFLILIIFQGIALIGIAQTGDWAVERGPVYPKKFHEGTLRIIKGGDGNFYILRAKYGHFWAFSPDGEPNLEVFRIAEDGISIIPKLANSLEASWVPQTTFEAIPVPGGIGLLSVEKAGSAKKLCIVKYLSNDGNPRIEKQYIVDLFPKFRAAQSPNFRCTWSQDGEKLLISWRNVYQEDLSDNGLACVMLDREMNVLTDVIYPLKQFRYPVHLQEIGITNQDQICMTVKAIQNPVAFGPSSIGYGLLEYDLSEQRLNLIKLSSSGIVPMDFRLFSYNKEEVTAGWYLDPSVEGGASGIFIGKIGESDTLEGLRTQVFSDELNKVLLGDQRKNGAFAAKRSYHSVLTTNYGYLLVLHFRGDFSKDSLDPARVHPNSNNLLVYCRINWDFSMQEPEIYGFYNGGNEAFREAHSWNYISVVDSFNFKNGKPWSGLSTFGIFSDFGGAACKRNDCEIQTKLLYLDGLLGTGMGYPFPEKDESDPDYIWKRLGKSEFEKKIKQLNPNNENAFAPRSLIQVAENEWIGVAISGKSWQLVKLRYNCIPLWRQDGWRDDE